MRALLRHPWVEPAVARGLLAVRVRQSVRFFLREHLGSDRVASYRVRGGRGGVVVLQHRRPDVQVLDEVLYQGLYEPPGEVAAILDAVGPDLRVLDLGGNVGLFGAWLTDRMPYARLVSYEPDERNAGILERTVARNVDAGLVAPGAWTVVRAAAGTRDGTARFAAGRFAMSRVVGEEVETGTVVDVAVRDVLARDLAGVDLLKMDVEGGEWAILEDTRFAPASLGALVLEYHPEGCDAADPHRRVVELLTARGFRTQRIPQPAAPEGVGMVWAWRD